MSTMLVWIVVSFGVSGNGFTATYSIPFADKASCEKIVQSKKNRGELECFEVNLAPMPK